MAPSSGPLQLEDDFEGLRRLAQTLLRDAGDAVDDVVHEAWLRSSRGAARERPGSGWWATVLRNVDRSRRRDAARRRGHEQIAAAARPEASEVDDPARVAQRLDAARALLDAVDGLDEPYRSTITLRYLEGLSPRAIAARSGVPVRTVHTRLQRGLVTLRGRLAARLGVEGDRTAWIAALVPLAMMSKKSAIAWTSGAVLGLGCLFGFLVAPLWWGGDGDDAGSGTPRVAAAGPVEVVADSAVREPDEAPARAALVAAEPGESAGPQFELRGVVVGLDDQPVPGVLVRIEPFHFDIPDFPAPTVVWTAVSDDDGLFRFACDTRPSGDVRCMEGAWVGVYEPVLWGQEQDGERELTLVVAPRRVLRGFVVDAVSRAALGDVDLHVTMDLPPTAAFARDLSRCRPAEWRAKSGAEGRFALAVAATLGGTQIHSALPGYEHDHRPIGELEEDLLVELQPSGALLSGQVVDARGEPAAGAAVLCGSAAAVADEQGRFTIDLTHVQEEGGTAPTGLVVELLDEEGSWASAPTPGAASGGSQRHRLLVAARCGELPAQLLGPAATWRDASTWPQPLVLRLGEPSLSIHGKVVERDGSPVEGVQVKLLDEQPLGVDGSVGHPWQTVEFLARVSMSVEGGATYFSEMDAGGAPGHFSVGGLQQRSYRLRVFDPRALRTVVTEPIAAGTNGLEIQLPEERLWDSVGGMVVDRRGAPVRDVTISVQRRFAGMAGAEPLGLWLRSDAEGRFRTEHPVSREFDALSVQAVGAAQPIAVDLSVHPDPTDLRLVVPVAVRVRIVPTDATRAARSVAFLDAEGRPVPVVITRGDTAHGSMLVTLTNGGSEVLEVLDTAAELVLIDDAGDKTRHRVELVPDADGVVELRI